MKRIFCLLLCLLCLCPAALAELTAEATVYDFGDFTLEVPAGAVVQQAEKTENAPFFACYPDYDATADFTTNYIIRWMDDDFSLSFAQVEADTLAQAYVDYAAELERAQGLSVDNIQLLSRRLRRFRREPRYLRHHGRRLHAAGDRDANAHP